MSETARQTTVGIVGLGLIGGSFSRALHALDDVTVLGRDIDESVQYRAVLTEAMDGVLDDSALGTCDVLVLALYPQAALAFIREYGADVRPGCIVVDLCGVKRVLFEPLCAAARTHGFTYIGAHPMAGTEKSGFAAADARLFAGASLVLTPSPDARIEEIERFKNLADRLGFTHFEVASPEHHDKMIAFTSQLAHVVSSAYIKSPTARRHAGFSAGSYKDMTRVARLNETMWTELFLENADFLSAEVEHIITELRAYADALEEHDEARLRALLRDGRVCKERIDSPEEAR